MKWDNTSAYFTGLLWRLNICGVLSSEFDIINGHLIIYFFIFSPIAHKYLMEVAFFS